MQEIITQIKKSEEELRLAMIKSDVEKLDELIDDSLVFVAPNGMIATKEMDLEAHRSGIQKMTQLVQSEQNIKEQESFVVVTVMADIAGTYADTSISGQYRYLRIWSKINDAWKVVSGSVVQII